MYEESEEYQLTVGNGQSTVLRRVFETPASVWYDPENQQPQARLGTSDLAWCNRVMEQGVLKRAGWPKIARKKYPFLVDTNIFCKHIDLATGTQYPQGELNGNHKGNK
jgi:hypothetical protein